MERICHVSLSTLHNPVEAKLGQIYKTHALAKKARIIPSFVRRSNYISMT